MVTIESSASITAWGERTFGQVSDLTALIERAREELEALQVSVENGDSTRDVASEAAGIAILLHRLVGLHGVELSFAIDEKMARNRTRIWSLAGDGTGRHVA
ncbi:hypothetical protein PsAD2_03346 [Pseudovibrio axinellae]|uniref:MazG nucleotide pyrophosphohydrolase domain protein n=1 Tax=Pseudovibrio axinellae TaxID=989403 RepID=A0A165WND0_9HYPH|nr:nucleotide pyrophosphohydrolase [Pseudovibrio axinellae]KZL16729.1 hypothetical protein PsAD2_03346 [Pseudovibrio axinellae]SEQ77044.1 hypothetical protein SAMN05421798_104164 [Pseudovibrio axinellae]